MKTAIVGIIFTTLLLLGSGYTAKVVLTTLEKITVTRIQKGLSSSEEFARQLTGKRLKY